MSTNIVIVTSPNVRCGIREASEMLEDELDPMLGICSEMMWGSPTDVLSSLDPDWPPDLFHLEHQAAALSQWTPEVCDDLRGRGYKVVVTEHDTYESLDLMRSRGLPDFHGHVDALIVHEPVAGLTDQGYPDVFYWRQPVPMLPAGCDWPTNDYGLRNDPPVVGTVGFDFP